MIYSVLIFRVSSHAVFNAFFCSNRKYKMVWCVVHFVLENTVEVVPVLWYEKKNCAWPKSSKIKEIKKAIFNQVRPNKHNFSFFEARCLCSNIGKYNGKLSIFCILN